MKIIDKENVCKLTMFVNTALLIYILSLTTLFMYSKIEYMVYVSYVYIVLYLLLYIPIWKQYLYTYVLSLYAIIGVYMVLATICVGMGAGFFLFCASLIPVIFYVDYIAKKINSRRVPALVVSGLLLAAYVACTGYVLLRGPLYEIPKKPEIIMFAVNSASVFLFLISYTQILINMIGESENKLSNMAHYDALTQIYNRHYVDAYINEQIEKAGESRQWLAILDIDFFKKINDNYGHNCGDKVLVSLSKLMSEVCKDCTIARWGGEEFIIHSFGYTNIEILDKLRKKVETTEVDFNGEKIHYTISVGASFYCKGETFRAWLEKSDEKLYLAKEGGRNKVVM